MKKPWEINVDASLEATVKRMLRLVMKPVLSVGNPGKCLFCGEDTSWTINGRNVCPRCTARYGFVKEEYLPDPCEVCGKQGEWCTDGQPPHSLCYTHRDAWGRWKKRDELLKGFFDLPEDKRGKAWEKCWAVFIKEMKEVASI